MTNKLRTPYPRKVLSLLAPLTAPTFRRRGFSSSSVFLDWDKIVGPEMGRLCQPEKLTFPKDRRDQGILILAAFNGSAALFLQHSLDLIQEHINTYFGYKAVHRIRIIQRPEMAAVPPKPVMKRPPSGPTFDQTYPPPTSGKGINVTLEAKLKSLYDSWKAARPLDTGD